MPHLELNNPPGRPRGGFFSVAGPRILAHRGFAIAAPENTLLAFANHGMVGELMRPDGGDADLVLNRLGQAGTDVGALAATLQREGAEAFVTSWKDLLSCLEAKSATLRDAALAGDRR